MLTYDVLAVLWETPATGVEVARLVEARTGSPCSRNTVENYLRILRTTGHVGTRNQNGSAAYVLTNEGSALLAQLSEELV